MFIYRNIENSKWYTIDLDTGISIGFGYTMCECKKATLDLLDEYRKVKETTNYRDMRILYNKLLKNEEKV